MQFLQVRRQKQAPNRVSRNPARASIFISHLGEKSSMTTRGWGILSGAIAPPLSLLSTGNVDFICTF